MIDKLVYDTKTKMKYDYYIYGLDNCNFIVVKNKEGETVGFWYSLKDALKSIGYDKSMNVAIYDYYNMSYLVRDMEGLWDEKEKMRTL